MYILSKGYELADENNAFPSRVDVNHPDFWLEKHDRGGKELLQR